MKSLRTLISIVCLILTPTAFANPEVPGKPQEKPIALVNAVIHPISGDVIDRGTILFDKGKIVALGKEVAVPEGAEKIDLDGKHVYPSLFDAWTDLGLVEINSVRATVDVQESGQINPNVKAIVAVNPDSEIIPVTRSNGVLLALTAPHGGLIAGKSAVIQLDGWTWEDMALLPEAAMHLEWPRVGRGRNFDDEEAGPAMQHDEVATKLRQTFADARAYAASRKADPNYPLDARWEALQPVLAGKLPVVIHADELIAIQAAVAFADQEKVKVILHGGYDAPRCASLLKKHNIPVVVAGVYRLPRRRGDDYDASYSPPARLHEAGIRFCISSAGRFGASNVRNLPYHAATAAAYGLPAEEALRSITLSPAEILGVADRVGSLAAGKDATLIVTTGDPLETATQVTAAYVQGRQVDLNDRHKRLWKKYEEKYKRLGPANP
ncbi:MAG: amidohydrolase family protein [Pirellulaceae bacterium]